MTFTAETDERKAAVTHRISAAKLYLSERIKRQLSKIETEPSPDIEKQWPDYERLRRLTERLRRHSGNSPWIPMGFAFAAAAIVIAVLWAHEPTTYVYAAPDNYFRILEKIDDYAFVMQRVERGVQQVPSVSHFCKDYRPQFEAGMTLQWFAYDDRGECQSLSASGRGYVIVRDSAKCPVVPANCRHTDCADWERDEIVCDGKPNFN